VGASVKKIRGRVRRYRRLEFNKKEIRTNRKRAEPAAVVRLLSSMGGGDDPPNMRNGNVLKGGTETVAATGVSLGRNCSQGQGGLFVPISKGLGS